MIKKLEIIHFNVKDDTYTTLALHVNEIRHAVNQLIDAHNAKEEVKEEEWPKTGNVYWYLTYSGETENTKWLEDDYIDEHRKQFGNCFRTKEESESARDKVKELLKSLNK